MMNRSFISCFMFMLLLTTDLLSADSTRVKEKNGSPKNEAGQEKGYKLQEYVNDIPQYGDYYEWDGTRWQRYKGDIPQYGNYLKEVKPEERGLEIKEIK